MQIFVPIDTIHGDMSSVNYFLGDCLLSLVEYICDRRRDNRDARGANQAPEPVGAPSSRCVVRQDRQLGSRAATRGSLRVGARSLRDEAAAYSRTVVLGVFTPTIGATSRRFSPPSGGGHRRRPRADHPPADL